MTPVGDTPSITSASTVVNVQTTSGLVVNRNADDGAEVTHVKITAVSGGSLFLNDGSTPVAAGSFVTIAQGGAGLRFTPALNSAATGHVSIQASTSNTDAGLGGAVVTADVAVNPAPSTTAVATSGSPSNPGQSVTFTATVTPAVLATSGTVQFMDGAAALGAPVALTAGTAAFSTTSLASGLHSISAVYGGNALAAASTGALAGGQVVRTPVTLVITSSNNPSPFGTAVTISATATHAGSGVPGGTMTFTDGSTTLGTPALSGGAASIGDVVADIGVHHLTVQSRRRRGVCGSDGRLRPDL